MSKLLGVMLASLVLTGCGGGGAAQAPMQATSADGTWAATTANPTTGPTPPTFSFTMTHNSGSMMTMGNLQMVVTTGCFGPGSVMTTTGQMSGGMMGGMMGPGTQITMDLWSDAAHTGNHLTMVMVMNSGMNGMTGTYTLTGVTPGCSSGSGTITMTHQ
jgi:hypothetical protein